MGMPSLSIYVNELIRDFGAQTLIRIGSCGGMQDHVGLRDVILAMTATTITSPSSAIFREVNFAPCADWTLLRAAAAAAEAQAPAARRGSTPPTPSTTTPGPERTDGAPRHPRVEMEAAELYTLAARHNRRRWRC